MTIHESPEATLPLREQLDAYSELCKRGRFLDALSAAERDQGPLHQWQHTELRIIAIRALGNLGLWRDADAVIFRTWRRNPWDPQILPYYIQAMLGRRGPLKAWEIYKAWERRGFPEGADRAFLLCIEADILARFRDFANADRCLSRAEALDEGGWIRLRRAQLLHDTDQFAEALEQAERVHREDPTYLGALRCYAEMLQYNNMGRQALEALQPYWEGCQSRTVGRQLCMLAIELREFDVAEACLEKMEQLLSRRSCPKYLRRDQDNLWADYHCARGNYEAALPYLEQKGFYQQRVSESIRERGGEGERRILPLPFIKQRHMTCAPASIATVLQFWGEPADQDEIAEAICYNGTRNYDERAWLLDQGHRLIEFELNFPQLRQLIDRGVPVLLTTVEPGSGHLQVIAGYDRTMGTYVLRDPSWPRLQEMLIEDGERYYASNGPRCIAVVPVSRAQLLEGLELRAADLYDDTFLVQRELEEHDYAGARLIAERMQAREPDHRLTLRAQLDLAYYVQDDARILQLTERLLEQFPDDVNLQLAKIQTLSRLNSARECLDYMEALEQRGQVHFLVRSRLVDSLRFDHRNDERVEKLLSSLLRQSPLHPQTLYARAGHLWDRGEYERACALYRFVTCLDEVYEGYAESYFKAERFLRRTETALEFLRDRFSRFGKKSSGPAISLFHALDALDRTDEGLEILHTGIELRPNDGELMLFTARRLLILNQVPEAETLVEQAKSHAQQSRYLALAADICAARQQRERAIELWQQVLQTEPLNYEACNTIARLYTEQDQYAQAISFLDDKNRVYPGNYRLQRMRLNWLADDDVERIEACCRHLIDSHPDDNWAYIKLAYLCSQRSRLDEALSYAREATRISRTDTEAWVQLGHIHRLRQEQDAAAEAFKQAISISCDCSAAFEPLLQCTYDLEQKKQWLAFIHGELMQQVSFGGGILGYQNIAQEWLPVEELLEFLHLALQQRPDLWHCWLALANGYRQQDNLEQAQATLLTAIKRFPLLPRLHLELAEVLRLRGDLPAAEARLRQALELNPDWAELHNNLADLLEFQGKYQEAIKTLEDTIRRLPGDAVPRGYLADLLWRQGDQKRALEQMDKAVALAPFYGWAWHKLCHWSREMGKGELASERLASARQRFPNNAMLARMDAAYREDPREKAEVLAAFTKVQPHHIDIAERYIEALADCGEFEQAKQICSTDYWKGEVPIEIRTRAAWLTRQEGKTAQAIEAIKEVTRAAPYFYEGWRLLANWSLDFDENDTAREALLQCRALYPNDASVLTFVAEGLQRLGGNTEEILTMLARAFEARPSDQYNGLTYLDLLIETEDWAKARQVLELIKLHSEDAFVLTRELQVLAAEQNDDDALLRVWMRLLEHPQSNDWVMLTAWDVMGSRKLQAAATESIKKVRKEERTLPPRAGYLLAEYDLGQHGFRKFEKQFRELTHADAFAQRALECYLDQLQRRDEQPARSFEPVLEKLIIRDTVNWGTYGLLLCRKARWFQAKHWFSNWRQQTEARAWMLYFASLTFRQCGDYDTGVETMKAAYHLQADNYRADIVCIHTLEAMLEGDLEAFESLRNTQLDNLDPPGRYALALCQVLAALGDGDFVSLYGELIPKLRDARYSYQQAELEAAQQLKRRVHRRLKETIKLTGLKRLFWVWRLSNYF